MSHDKLTVDEPLISTDVDKLIRTIAEKKRVALNELRQSCRIDKRTMDKWIAVLEDEGYIDVEYGLRGTYIVWKEAERDGTVPFMASDMDQGIEAPAPEQIAEAPEEKGETAQDSGPKIPIPYPDSPSPAEAEPEPEKKEEEQSPVVDVTQDSDPDLLLSQYLESKKSETRGDIDSIKSNILTSLADDDAKSDTVEASAPEEPSPEKEETPEPEQETVAVSEDVSPEVPTDSEEEEREEGTRRLSQIMPKKIAAPPPISRESRPVSGEVRELMNSYLQEINKEKATIEDLKKQKESLYREKFSTLEGRMQADLGVLTEKVLEKHEKIAQLKEQVLALPDKISELESLQVQMEALRKEGREALQKLKEKTQGFVSGIEASKGDVQAKMEKIDAVIQKQSTRVKELEGLGNSLDTRSGKLKDIITNTKTQLDDLNSAMTLLTNDLQDVEGMKVNINAMTGSVKATVAVHGEELQSLEEELEGISRVEHWIEEYVRDYEDKIEGIEHYVATSENELADLKEAAESHYMKKYLGEMENMTGSYENELDDAVSKDKDVDQKIEIARSRISELARESQEMIRRLRTDVSGGQDYETLLSKVKDKTAKVKSALQEKQQERGKLIDDSRKVRKTKSSDVAGRLRAKALKAKKKKRK